jgi:hypothetical protein
MNSVSAFMSFLIPGLGQCMHQRWLDAALMVFLITWLRLTLSAIALYAPAPVDPLIAAFWGVLAFEGPSRTALVILLSVAIVVVHVLSALDAYRDRQVRNK